MNQLTLAAIAAACRGRIEGGTPETVVQGVSTDTRTLQRGELFVALPGETHNGHDYAAAACEQGAGALLLARDTQAACPRIIVEDTLIAYGRLGAMARQESDATFLAVTGSAGKTTTKDALGSIVRLAGPSLVTPETENNEVGIPRLLLQLTPDHRYCVSELGMRAAGEIAYIADLCAPQIGIITNVGEAHLGRLGSRDAIAEAKAELLGALPPDGVAVLNADDFFFGVFSEMAPCPVASFGFGDAPPDVMFHATAEDLHARGIEPARFRLRIGVERRGITLQAPGEHNVANALAAAAAAFAAGISLDAIEAGLEDYAGSDMRSQVIRAPQGYAIINDAYNASPTSTPEALKMLGGCAGRRVFVFGEMLELGQFAEDAHRNVGRLAAEHGVDWLITVGNVAAFAAVEADAHGLQVNSVADIPKALALLKEVLEPGDTILVKASRGSALEGVVKGLLGEV